MKAHHITALVIFLFSSVGNAATIAFSDWHDNTGPVDGLRQSEVAPSLYYAVSLSNSFSFADTYLAKDGFHFATRAEVFELFPRNYVAGSTNQYYNKAGWNGYSWNGVIKFGFAYAETGPGNYDYMHAGWNQTEQVALRGFSQQLLTDYWAGYLMVENQSAVPIPAAAFMFAPALLGFLGFRRKLRA